MAKLDEDTFEVHKTDIARRLIEQGSLTDEFIAMCSGLTVEQIHELKVKEFGHEE